MKEKKEVEENFFWGGKYQKYIQGISKTKNNLSYLQTEECSIASQRCTVFEVPRAVQFLRKFYGFNREIDYCKMSNSLNYQTTTKVC